MFSGNHNRNPRSLPHLMPVFIGSKQDLDDILDTFLPLGTLSDSDGPISNPSPKLTLFYIAERLFTEDDDLSLVCN